MIRKIQKFDIDDFLKMFEPITQNDSEKSLVQIVDDVLKSFEDTDKGEKIIKLKDYNVYDENDRINYEFLLAGFERNEISVDISYTDNLPYLIVTAIKRKSTRQYIERNTDLEKLFKIKIDENLINEDIKSDFIDGILTISFKEEQKQKNMKIL